ncbi:MAG: hypothetical protein ABSA82_03410 [Thermacetogeniaceae bacterium]|jgi:hypothetical protein
MKKGKQWLVIVLAVVILGAVAVGVAVADNAPTAGQSPQNLYQAFLGNLASALGIDQTTLTNALKTASTQTVNQEVQSGKLTQQQADQILSRINSGKLPIGFMGMGFGNQQSVSGAVYGKRGPRVGRNRGAMGGFMILKPLASALGITPQVLMSDLRSGQTISALATADGTTVTALGASILSSIQIKLTSAVSSGKLTSAQETQIYTRLQQFMSSPNWDTQLQKIGQPGSFHHKSGGQPVTQ